ncbi:MAG: carboxypeptidase regulatory-like domain-containing protein [Planctomycetota bacterium]
MIDPRPRAQRRLSWLAGLCVLAGLGWTLWSLWSTARQLDARLPPAAAVPPPPPAIEAPAVLPLAPAPKAAIVRRLQGLVRGPDGAPVAGTTVTVYRALTAGPEWRREAIDQPAITGPDGAFVFALSEGRGLLVSCDHRLYARALVPVPEVSDRLEIALDEGFELAGSVTTDFGGPLGGVRVAAEAVGDAARSVEVAVTTANGGFRFDHRLPAGLVRLVARHDRWQAVSEQVLVGETREASLRFNTPALAPLRGRVVTTGQVPVQGALVQLVPTSGRLGLVDPISATSDRDGTFALAGLSRGPMALLARHEDHGSARRTVSIGTGAPEIVLELPPRSIVAGTLAAGGGGDDVTPRGAALQLTDAAGEIQHAVVGDDGAFAFARPVVPGRATLLVHGGVFAFAKSQGFDTNVQIEESPRTVLDLGVVAPTVVRGRCVDENQRPLAGVLVHGLRPLTASRLIGSELAARIGAGAFEVASSLGGDGEALLAVSGDDGTFEFRGWQPGPLQLRCSARNRAVRAMRYVVPPAGEVGQLGDVGVVAGGRIEGVVTRGGRALAGVPVMIVGDEVQTTVVSQTGGRFSVRDLAVGSYRVRARLPSMPTGQAEQTVVVALQRPAQVRLALPPGRTVHGTVTGRDGQAVANAQVTVRGSGAHPALTDAEGRFVLELPSRQVELQVAYGEAGLPHFYTVRADQDRVAVVFDAEPTGTMVAAIVGLPGRKRVPGVLLRLARLDGREHDELLRWIEVQNGTVRWPLAPVGHHRIEIWCEGYMPYFVERTLEPNAETDLGEILLEPGAAVRGRIVDAGDHPIANARVFVGDEACLGAFEPEARSAADGTFAIAGVSSRCTTVVAQAAGFAPCTHELVLPHDVLAADEIRLALQPGSSIVVEVLNAPEAGLVRLLRGGRVLASAVLDDTGRAEFADRGVGEYSVQLVGSDQPQKPARIETPGSTVHVVL